MIDVIMPMLGKGERMEGLQDTIKPLVKTKAGKPLFKCALDSLKNFNVEKILMLIPEGYTKEFNKYLDPEDVAKVFIMEVIKQTESQVETVTLGAKALLTAYNNKNHVICLDCDIAAELPADELGEETSAKLFVFKHDNPNKSFVKVGRKYVKEIKEKEAISDLAVFGAYMFKNLPTLLNNTTEGDKCMSDIVSRIIKNGGKVEYSVLDNVRNYGTLKEYEETTEDETV